MPAAICSAYTAVDNLSDLLSAEFVTFEERAWIDDLLARKAAAREAAPIGLDASRAASIRSELERYASMTARCASATTGP